MRNPDGLLTQALVASVSSRQSKKGTALELVYPHTDRDARHRHERRATRQRLLRHLRLIASGNRELRRPRPGAQRLFRRLHPGCVSVRENHRTDPHIRAYAAFAGLVAAAVAIMPLLNRIAFLGDPASNSRVRLRRHFRHDRELVERKGPAIRARTSFLDLYGRHVPCHRAGPALDSPSGYHGGGIVQCDRRTVRCSTDHGYRCRDIHSGYQELAQRDGKEREDP